MMRRISMILAAAVTAVALATPAAHASKWAGWHQWCPQHPRQAHHLAICHR